MDKKSGDNKKTDRTEFGEDMNSEMEKKNKNK